MKEASIWVDQYYGGLIGHGAFVRTLCSNNFQHKTVSWKIPGNSYFKRENLPLSCCEFEENQTMFHLFSLGEAAWGAFHKEHSLDELSFKPNLAGMIVIIDRQSVVRKFEEEQNNVNNSSFIRSIGGIHFSWFEKQGLPFVIAAAGYQEFTSDVENLRDFLGVSSEVPIILGPPLWQESPLQFDFTHATQVMIALHQTLNVA